MAKRKSKTIKEVVKDAVRGILEEKVNPADPLFSSPHIRKRTGRKDRGSLEHDKYLYGEEK